MYEFLSLFKYAVDKHKKSHEPIPEMDKYNLDKIDSCLKTPFMTFDGKDLYPSTYDKASILFYILIKNHPLSNGNKRMSFLTTKYFLEKNKIDLKLSNDVVYKLAMDVTKSKSAQKDYYIKRITKTLIGNS